MATKSSNIKVGFRFEMKGCKMKALSLGLLLATAAFSNSHAQRSPDSLPPITVDCYQSFASKAQLLQLPSNEVALDAGNFEPPPIRYRLQGVEKTILKIIKDPDRPAFRTEHGKSVWEMARDFTNSHKLVGWREQLSGGRLRLYTFDFEDLLFTTVDSPVSSSPAGIELHVMRCRHAT
ncbi:hypothetical protein [Bradyrhizobium lupini]|jgi:hypothetical protein